MKKENKRKIEQVLFIISLLFSLIIFPFLPAKIPSHFNSEGIPSYSSKFTIFFFPILLLIFILLFKYLPKIDPLKENYKFFNKYYEEFKLVIMLYFLYLQVLIIFYSFIPFKMNFFIILGISLLFLEISRLLKHCRRTWFLGIRTPWTLSSDLVWQKTHEFGSKVFLFLAIYTLNSYFFIKGNLYYIFFIIILLFSILLIFYYSYSVFKLQKQTKKI
ncbi:MAG: SdpI family protein [Candidatus Woesearchaeota archaeon]